MPSQTGPRDFLLCVQRIVVPIIYSTPRLSGTDRHSKRQQRRLKEQISSYTRTTRATLQVVAVQAQWEPGGRVGIRHDGVDPVPLVVDTPLHTCRQPARLGDFFFLFHGIPISLPIPIVQQFRSSRPSMTAEEELMTAEEGHWQRQSLGRIE